LPPNGDPSYYEKLDRGVAVSVLATDSFDRADGGLGVDWTTITGLGAPAIVGNVVQTGAVGSDSGSRYSAIVWPNDQWASSVVVEASGPGRANGPAVRMASAANTYYGALAIGAPLNGLGAGCTLELGKRVAGSYTTLIQTTETIVAGDVVTIAVTGTMVSVYLNDVLKITTTDTDIASGSAGLAIFADTGVQADSAMNDWQGGDYSADVAPPHPLYRKQTAFGLSL
jgi:hypothetical protein